jgi:regulator of cell morphogenesis and NO signaling
MFIKHGQ